MEVTGQYERTFITFENDIDNKLFESYFPTPDAARKHRQICAVTRLPARYYDPITQLPYRNMQAFKILREAYYQQLEERGNTDNPDVARWLEWRKKIKECLSCFSCWCACVRAQQAARSANRLEISAISLAHTRTHTSNSIENARRCRRSWCVVRRFREQIAHPNDS